MAERSIRPFVMGRKSWLFCNTHRGAGASANIYSIVETARANELNLYNYVTYLLKTLAGSIPDTDAAWEALMPWSDRLPASVRAKSARQEAEN